MPRTTQEQRDTACGKIIGSSASTYTKEVLEAIKCLIHVCADLEEAEAQAQRYREALERIMEKHKDERGCPNVHSTFDLARNALEEPKP